MLLLILGNQGVGLLRLEVMIRVTLDAIGSSGQSKVELGVLVGRVVLEPGNPCIEAEAGSGLVDLLVPDEGRALVAVIELGEDHVEGHFADNVGKASIWNHALGSSRDENAWLLGPSTPDEVIVVLEDELLRWDIGFLGLKIEIETIDSRGTERTRLSCRCPLAGKGPECSKEELRKVLSDRLGRQVVVGRRTTTQREQNLLASSLAVNDGLFNTSTVLQKLAVLGAIVGVRVVSPASVCVVRFRIISNLLREAVDEADVDDVDTGITADLRQGNLVTALSPVYGDVLGRCGIVCGGGSRGQKPSCNGSTCEGGERHDYVIN